jgi:hypothetical protein
MAQNKPKNTPTASSYRTSLERLRKYMTGKTVVVPDGDKKLRLKTIPDTANYQDPMWGYIGRGMKNTKLFSQFYNNPEGQRILMFSDYNMMERDPIISRALTLIAEEACLPDENEEIIHIHTDNEMIKVTLEHLFYEILKIDFSLQSWIRQMLKYGDCFVYLNIQEKVGVTDAIVLPSSDVERIEEDNGTIFKAMAIFASEIPEERMLHFRNIGNTDFLPYGLSHLEPVRRHWRMMTLLEDFMMVYYLLRSVNQRVFYTDVGAIPSNAIEPFLNMLRDMYRREPIINPRTNEYDLYYDPMTVIEDIVIPTREGYENTRVDELPASPETNITEGLNLLRQKIMAGLGVPNFLLNYEEQLNSRATASSEDVRMAKFVESVQRIMISELEKVAFIHLLLLGFEKKELFNFSLSLTPPSNLHEMEKLELLDKRVETANSLIESGLYSKDWVWENVFGFSDGEIEIMKAQILQDKLDEKMTEEQINSFTFEPDEEEDLGASDDSSFGEPESGDGSRGGQVEPNVGLDDTQLDSPEVEASDLIDDGNDREAPSENPERRNNTTEDRQE